MPSLKAIRSAPAKVLFMADSGFGKTGALASLANAGYRLFIHDFDLGSRVLGQFLTPEALNRVIVRQHSDKVAADGIGIYPEGAPEAYRGFIQECAYGFEDILDSGEEIKVPAVTGLGPDDVFVLDSLTMYGWAAMRYTLMVNAPPNSEAERLRWMHPYPGDYGEAQSMCRRLLEMLYSEAVQCNVVVNTHVRYVGGGGTQITTDKKTGHTQIREVDSESEGDAIPTSIGRALGRETCRYFNTVISGEFQGSGLSAERYILTRDLPRFPLKNERPLEIDQKLPISTGLADLFEGIRGTAPEL